MPPPPPLPRPHKENLARFHALVAERTLRTYATFVFSLEFRKQRKTATRF